MVAQRLHWFLFAVVLSAGIWARFHALDRQSLWDDEVSTIKTISLPYSQWLNRFQTYEVHPPLYFLQLRAWRAVFGNSLVRLRANSAFWGSISLLLMYALGSLYGGNASGLLAMTLLAVSPLHLAYSQEARPYAFAIALAVFGLWVLERGLDSKQRQLFFVLTLVWVCELYTHYWGSFVVAAQALYGYLRCHPPRSPAGDPWIPPLRPGGMTPILVCLAFSAGVFALWLPVLSVQMDVVNHLVFWAPPFSLANLVKPLAAFSGLYFPMASYAFYLPTTVGVILAFGSLFVMALVVGIQKGPAAALYWLCVGLGIPWVLSFWSHPIFVWYRYPILILPAFVLLMAAGMMALKPRWFCVFVIGACMASQLWGDWFYYVRWQKANPKAVVQYIHRLKQPNSVVVRPFYFADLFNFYDQETMLTVDQHLLDSPRRRALLRGQDIILVAFDVPSDPIGDALRSEFQVISTRHFPGYAHLGITVCRLK